MKLPENGTVLFFAPHPDDESIAAGALLYDLVKRGNHVAVYFLCNSPKGITGDMSDEDKINLRQEEARAGCGVLGVSAVFLSLDGPSLEETDHNVAVIRNVIESARPSLVITTNGQEAHPTHRKTTQLVESAMEDSPVPLWYGEVWSPIAQPHYVHFFDEAVMEVKLRALAQYKSQMVRTDWLEACRSLNRFRALTGREVVGDFGSSASNIALYAEAFGVKT